jgi:glycosyltransferase involved in cell wall biosynthesis
MRELYIKSFLEIVDHFISPSEFLKRRYVEWGLPAEKISVIENGQAAPARVAPSRVLGKGQRRSRFGFLGQVSPYKGLHVLLAAIDLLPLEIRDEVFVEIHGANLELQQSSYRDEVQRLHERVKDRVQFFGRYEHSDLPDIMANIDWVVIPSVWWENSPLVIQEAFLHRRPVICSNIGGMAEKVENEKTGFHFRVGSPSHLAATIERVVGGDGLWEKCVGGIQPPPSIAETSKLNVEVYRNARSESRSANGAG